jgi:tRNA A37 threonylcarbamoyladenosine biosynthesis protein TsaE
MYWGCAGPPVHHFDLYRLETPESLSRLELDESFKAAVSLIEWAERLGPLTPPDHLAVEIRLMTPVSPRTLS